MTTMVLMTLLEAMLSTVLFYHLNEPLKKRLGIRYDVRLKSIFTEDV